MKIESIEAVYNAKGDIKPIGKTISDENGEKTKCPKCSIGILFLEFQTANIRCTQCDYVKQQQL